ncbi:hypothetical protein RMATCC62417_08240 [Rhizopus microsporus]|nr:hypothetical protein RMATCC62417_08240 [Rhizopus microsporus]CEI89402.1 hypothetical protein RMCBS344292_03763 [Rhizopus microsporus]
MSMLIGIAIVATSILFIVCKSKGQNSKDSISSFQKQALEAANLKCQETLWWLPTLIKVYLIGILETIYIAVYKRGLFPSSITKEENEAKVSQLIDRYLESHKQDNQQPIAVITGGDSGIGLEITKSLKRCGFELIIGTRSKELCEKLIGPFSTPKGHVEICELDLADFSSVHSFASRVKSILNGRRIDLLINNAGVMNVPYLKTVDGFESQCQINYMSPTLLSKLLLLHMNTEYGRILFASSSTLYAVNKLDTNTPLTSYSLNGLDHYAYSKSCIAHIAQYLSVSAPSGVKVYAYHPGTVRTKLFNHTTVFTLRLFSKLFDFIMLTPKEGSITPLYLCLANVEDLENNTNSCYWADQRQHRIAPTCVNGSLNNTYKLWEDTLLKCRYNEEM